MTSAFPDAPKFPALIENAGKRDPISSQAGLGSFRTRDFDGPGLMGAISSIVGFPAPLPPKPLMTRAEAFAHFRSALPATVNEATATEAFNIAWHAAFEAGAAQEVLP